MKLPSAALSVAAGVVPFVLGVTDCLPTVISLAFTVPALPSSPTVPVVTLPSLPLITTGVSVPLAPLLPLLKVVSPLSLNSTLPEFAPLVMLLMLARFLFIFTVNVELPSACTKILPLADWNPSTCSFVTPSPTMFTNVFSLCLFSVPELLPVKRKPSSIVAT